ncbi:ABC transporter permease [Rugosimonospora africana]|uniref:ABC transporter permease n=1 Tax=Rugosimonospora africana TaxID=556532 RepID=A0A8J3QRX5_9ACTN|nr:ABC transporter permease [Rugosimonospora africana]GIH15768.1 ABC transporter permease [Rugosimonospora africana]
MTTLNLTGTLPAATGRSGLTNALRSEWTKIRSVRSTLWSIGAMAAVAVGLNALINWLTIDRRWAQMVPGERSSVLANPLDNILASPMTVAQFAVAVIGVMAISAEYSTGMVRSTLQAQPRRMTILGAKILVIVGLMLVVGEALSFAAYATGKAVIAPHVPVHLSDPGALRAVIGAGLYIPVLALFSLAAGAILRHTAAAITAVLGIMLVVSNLTQLLPDSWGHHINAYMPMNAGSLVFQQHVAPKQLLTPWQGLGVFAAETAILVVVAAFLMRRRDA